MADIFLLKVVLSFIVGSAYTLVSTVTADKLGPKIGGLISGLPSTVLFGLVFIGWTQSIEATVDATTLIPAIIGVACLFLITYIYFVKRNIWLAVFLAILVWSIAAYVLLALHITSFIVSIVIFFVLYSVGYVFVTRIFKISTVKGNKIVYSPQVFLMRGLISGFIVALSVILAKTGGPVLGGMVSAFPAMFSSSLLITYFAHGPAFSSAIAKNSLFAWISTLIFVIVARYTYIPLGIIFGSIVALLASYISAYFLYNAVVRKHA
jgi:uncharacterized membrane protein (GlpM family)